MEKELENRDATPFGCSNRIPCTWVCDYGGIAFETYL